MPLRRFLDGIDAYPSDDCGPLSCTDCLCGAA